MQFYVGKDIADVPKPAAVIDVAIIRKHCERMKGTVKALGVGFRAHVKTHKVSSFPAEKKITRCPRDTHHRFKLIHLNTTQTLEIASMQVDSSAAEANFIVSTLLEA